MTNYHDVARNLLCLSNCLRRKYACVIVRDDVIISTGYNKSLKGCTVCARENIEHSKGDYSECGSVHAEQMALIRANGDLVYGATLYLVCDQDEDPKPCSICKRMIDLCGINVGVEKVWNQS